MDLERFRSRLQIYAALEVGPTLRTKLDADDLVQETFLAAMVGEPFRGETESQQFAWLRAILASRIDKAVERFFGTSARDLRRETGWFSPSGSSRSGLAGDLTTPSQAATRRENAERVAEALTRLPADYAQILIARTIHGQSFPEIAASWNRSVGAVTMLWVRAVQSFREILPNPL